LSYEKSCNPSVVGSISTFEKYQLENKLFLQSLTDYISHNNFLAIEDLLRNYFLKFHTERDLLVSLSQFFKNEVGNFRLAQLCAEIHLDVVKKINSVGVGFYGLPKVCEDLPTTNFFELVDTLISVKILLKLGVLKNKPVLLSKNVDKLTVDYLSECFDLASDSNSISLASEIRHLSPFNLHFFQASNTIFGSNDVFFNFIYPEMFNQNIDIEVLKPFANNLNYSRGALDYLNKNQLLFEERYVVLYLDNNIFVNFSDDKKRKQKIETDYNVLIKWFLSKDFKVVFFGASGLFSDFSDPRFIDVTIADITIDTQLLLLMKASFYVGSCSSFYKYCNSIGVPSLLTQAFPMEIRGNTLANCYQYVYENTSEPVNISELKKLNLVYLNSKKAFNKNGVHVRYPSSEEIVQSGEVMLDYLKHGEIYKLNLTKDSYLDALGIRGHLTAQSLNYL